MDKERLKEKIKIYKEICDDVFINTLGVPYKLIAGTKPENLDMKFSPNYYEIVKTSRKNSGFGAECYIMGKHIVIAYAAAWGFADAGNMIGLVAGFLQVSIMMRLIFI